MLYSRSSSDIGVDVFELDCHMTKDGKVVVAHDNNLSRLCGVERLISETNYDVRFHENFTLIIQKGAYLDRFTVFYPLE